MWGITTCLKSDIQKQYTFFGQISIIDQSNDKMFSDLRLPLKKMPFWKSLKVMCRMVGHQNSGRRYIFLI